MMMKIGGPDQVSRARATRTTRGRKIASGERTTGPHEVTDSVSILGIPETEMTAKVRDAIMRLMEEVDRVRTELEHTQKRLVELERLADQDPLAPISNRRAFVRELGRIIAFGDRYGAISSLIYFDVNDFKAINDRHGHAAGDAILVHLAQLLLKNLRESDVVGRLGGDEFGVILVQADEQTARAKAESLSATVAASPFDWQGNAIALTVAFGVYTFRPGEDAGRALAEADREMYARKRTMKTAT